MRAVGSVRSVKRYPETAFEESGAFLLVGVFGSSAIQNGYRIDYNSAMRHRTIPGLNFFCRLCGKLLGSWPVERKRPVDAGG